MSSRLKNEKQHPKKKRSHDNDAGVVWRLFTIARGRARLCALPTTLRLDPHILAVIARFVPLIPHGHECIPENLQRGSAHDCLVGRYRRVVQYPVARLSKHRVDFQLRTLVHVPYIVDKQERSAREGGGRTLNRAWRPFSAACSSRRFFSSGLRVPDCSAC
jgi:hypothetical protein